MLAIDAKNSKALFRRGCAYNALNDTDRAKVDLEKYGSLQATTQGWRLSGRRTTPSLTLDSMVLFRPVFDRALLLVPGDQAIIRELHAVRTKEQAYAQRSKQMFAKVGTKLFEGAAQTAATSRSSAGAGDDDDDEETSGAKEQTFVMDG